MSMMMDAQEALVEWWLEGGLWSTWGKFCPSAILSTSNPTQTALGLILGPCGKKPVSEVPELWQCLERISVHLAKCTAL